MKKEKNISAIAIYKSKDGHIVLDARLKEEMLWLSLDQIAQLFSMHKSGISRHIKNIYATGELSPSPTVAKIATVQKEGERKITRHIEYYNLDMILSVGYRVNSKIATRFRIWATSILKKHILKGYTINQRRLGELKTKQLLELEETVNLIRISMESKELSSGEASGLLKVITEYANSWLLLQKFDEGDVPHPPKTATPKYRMLYNEAKQYVTELKNNLIAKKEASELFGLEVDNKFEAIAGNIYQTFDGKELYRSIEEKAAHLFYFIIRDHPFVDGNKRIASFCLIVFLSKNNHLIRKNGEKKLNDNALVALALLVAQSDPGQKEIMVKLIMRFLSG